MPMTSRLDLSCTRSSKEETRLLADEAQNQLEDRGVQVRVYILVQVILPKEEDNSE